MSEEPEARLWTVVIDTDDPPGLAAFYAGLLGWRTDESEESTATIVGPGGAELTFQLAINHRPPSWPEADVPQQLHLDFAVRDVAASAERAERLGARPAEVPRGRTFVTMIDPSGHPFCLCLAPEQRPNTLSP